MTSAASLHVLFLPSFYATSERPYNGSFFRDWVLALAGAGVRIGVAFVEDRPLRGVSLRALAETRFQVIHAVEDGVPIVRLRGWNTLAQSTAGGLVWARLMQRAIRAYVRRHGRPDLIVAGSAIWAGEAARLASRRGVPYAVIEINTAFGTGDVKGWTRRVSRRVFHGAESVVAISRNLQARLEAFGGTARVDFVPCAVNEDYWTLPPAPRRRSPFTFLSQAHLTPRKGMDVLMRAFAARFRGDPSVRLVIGGGGAILGDLQQLAETVGVRTQVSFPGARPRDEVRRSMWEADAFVLASRSENFGVVIIEALATGLPVIATRCGGPEDIIAPEVGLLVEPGDEAGLGEALERVYRAPLYDPDAMRAFAIARYGYRTVGGRLRDLLLSLQERP